MGKKGLLCVSFGTTHAETREKTIDAIEARLNEAFPDRAFYSAWSSEVIRKKAWESRGEHHDNVAEALAKVHADGVDDLVLSTTFLMPGREMKRVEAAVAEWAAESGCKVSFADPLLSTDDDLRMLADAVCEEFSQLGDDEALLLMGHGSPHGANEVYGKIWDCLRACGRERFFVATVEGEPTFDEVLPQVLACNASCVTLAPLMIVAGDHANNDLAGEGEDSWQSILRAHGVSTRAVLKGLGEYLGVQELVCAHARAAATSVR